MQKQNLKVIFLVIFFWLLFGWTENSKAADYWISPTGSDSNDGLSEAAPIATFIHAQTFLVPGDTLILMDGTYNQQLAPRVSGTEGNPISYVAQNRGRAIIQMLSDTPYMEYFSGAIVLWSTSPGYVGGPYHCHDIVVDGLIARSYGESYAIGIGSWDTALEAEMTNRITVKNAGAFGSAPETNSSVWAVGNNAVDILIEDSFAYGAGRSALIVFGSKRVTVRRVVLRYDWWTGAQYKINDPRRAFTGYNTEDSIFENIIVLDNGPEPPGVTSSGRAAYVASGNLTPAYITHSSRNKYMGLLALNNPVDCGLLVNGGSGGVPNEDITVKDFISWKSGGPGVNIESNDDGTNISFATLGHSTTSIGYRIDANPQFPVTNEIVTNTFSVANHIYGYYYLESQMSSFINNTGLGNLEGQNPEPSYAPTMDYLVRPTMVSGHERGGTMVNRYVDGILTETPLWPWANEDLIKQHMCNSDDLIAVHRVAANGAGWEPEWCASNKTLTEHIWEYLGNDCPVEICNYVPDLTAPASPTGLGIM